MATVLMSNPNQKDWEQIRIPRHLVVPYMMKGYRLVPHSLIIERITREKATNKTPAYEA